MHLAGSLSTAAPLLQSLQNQQNKKQVIQNCVLWPDTCKRTEHDLNSQPGTIQKHATKYNTLYDLEEEVLIVIFLKALDIIFWNFPLPV